MIKNLIIRSISGLVMASLLIGALILTEISGFIVLTIVGVLSVYEFLSNINKSERANTLVWYSCINSITISVLLFLATSNNDVRYFAIIAPIIIIRFIVEIFRNKKNPIESISYEIFAMIYALLPMLLLTFIDGKYVVALLFIVWANDVGAYFTGVTLGRHKLCERLSPKKSWEGFWGGIIVAITVAFLISYHLEGGVTVWMITGGVIALSAVVGDLFESMFKRSLEIKDSGNMIPGHGGMLDRFDALFFAAPLFYMIYILLLR